ncbi:MAG: hypothetical protein EOO61_05110 [Hymenobacter sp.]|nr:MAG: hypothetical protein EOO61_05110 [Hymenobacter sp.]
MTIVKIFTQPANYGSSGSSWRHMTTLFLTALGALALGALKQLGSFLMSQIIKAVELWRQQKKKTQVRPKRRNLS